MSHRGLYVNDWVCSCLFCLYQAAVGSKYISYIINAVHCNTERINSLIHVKNTMGPMIYIIIFTLWKLISCSREVVFLSFPLCNYGCFQIKIILVESWEMYPVIKVNSLGDQSVITWNVWIRVWLVLMQNLADLVRVL